METIIFKDKNWNEIPKNENPVFSHIQDDTKNERRKQCILICKVFDHLHSVVGKDGVIVIKVPLRGEIIRVGYFWNIEDAIAFSEGYSKKELKLSSRGNILVNQEECEEGTNATSHPTKQSEGGNEFRQLFKSSKSNP